MALGNLGKKKDDASVKLEPHELISSSEVEQIRRSLIETHADLVVQGMLDDDVRERLERIVRKNYKQATKGNPDVIAYVVRETIGTGVIEEILRDESITDVGYNGNELIIESNDKKEIFVSNFEISENYIIRLVNKFANANNKEFTSKNPIFDGRFRNVRINAVHSQNTAPESGTTMALRVVRPRLALTKDNFEGFAPMFMYDFFRAAALSKSNMVIAGITGTGKTELHKLISGFIPFDHRILLIEDTPETFMKQMFPDKDVYSWVTSEGVGVTQLIKAGLRNNPTWIMVTETRGAEAYEMVQAVLSGHSIITSLHATSARAIPSRFVNMAKMGYQLSEDALIDDIRRYFHFGIHIKKVKYNGHVIRYLSEVIAFDPKEDKTIFKQRFVDGVFYFETFELPDEFKESLEESMITLDYPAGFKSERPFDPKNATFEATIPLDKTGRPDYEKIKKMGTTLAHLMGREDKMDDSTKEDALDSQSQPDVSDDKTPSGSGNTNNQAMSKIKQLKRRVHIADSDVPEAIVSTDTDARPVKPNQAAKPVPTQKPRRRGYVPPTPEPKRSIEDILEQKRQMLHKDDV